MALGMFVFETRSVPYQQLQRRTEWRHASQSRVGERPAYQFVGAGTDTITLSGTLLLEFTGVRAYWNDPREAKRQVVIAGGTEKLKELRAVSVSEADATDAARSEWQRIQRRAALFELTLAHGRADLAAETPVTVAGFKPPIDGTDWLITDVEDILDDNGYITRIRCEVKA